MKNTFDFGPEGWCSYDYHASIVANGNNIFILATHSKTGGVNNSGYVWADEKRWSADTPEVPISILPFIFYRNWIDANPVNLENSRISVYLRGDNLNLYKAKCYFWVHANNTRWHNISSPLTIHQGEWGDIPDKINISSDQSKWHNSWKGLAKSHTPIKDVLRNCESYGFSFVGFEEEVRGKFSIDEFEIKLNK